MGRARGEEANGELGRARRDGDDEGPGDSLADDSAMWEGGWVPADEGYSLFDETCLETQLIIAQGCRARKDGAGDGTNKARGPQISSLREARASRLRGRRTRRRCLLRQCAR